MAKATKTIKQPLSYKVAHASYFAATKTLFNQVYAFYFGVIQAHPGILELSSMEALGALERLTHATKQCPHPVMPLTDLAPGLPAMFRRAAINAALGSAHSFYTHLATWRKCKELAEAKGKKYTVRPPVPPRWWNRSVTLYAGLWRACAGSSILLKVWTGNSWAWVKIAFCGRRLPEGWEANSPQLVCRKGHWYLHVPMERELARPKKVEEQVKMRLVRKGDDWVAHFTQVWEVEHLQELGDVWVPFALAGQREPIGEIHARTLAIKLSAGIVIADRQVVVLQE